MSVLEMTPADLFRALIFLASVLKLVFFSFFMFWRQQTNKHNFSKKYLQFQKQKVNHIAERVPPKAKLFCFLISIFRFSLQTTFRLISFSIRRRNLSITFFLQSEEEIVDFAKNPLGSEKKCFQKAFCC